MNSQSYSLFFIPAGCTPTQQDGESITDGKKNASSSLSTKSIYMLFKALLTHKLLKIFEINFRQNCRFQDTIFKATELQLWLTRYSVIKLRFPLIKTTRVLSQVFHKSPILKGYTIFLNALSGLNAHRKELEKTHKFLFGDYPKEIGSHTDV